MSAGSVLETNVLVLNRFYMAIRVINVRRAITLLYRDCAEVILMEGGQFVSYDFESWVELSQLTSLDKQPDEDYLQAVHCELRVPRICRLTRFDRMLTHAVRFNRKNLFARDGYQCQYCGQKPPSNRLSLDHVVPRSLGGQTTWENIVTSCIRCNTRKANKLPHEAQMFPSRPPRTPRWRPMFGVMNPADFDESWSHFVDPSPDGVKISA